MRKRSLAFAGAVLAVTLAAGCSGLAPTWQSAAGDTSPGTSAPRSSPGQAAVGTRGNPAPTGEALSFADWSVTIGAANTEAWAEIHKSSDFANPPGQGKAYVSAPLTATYNGEDSADAGMSFSYAFVTAGGNVLDTLTDDCGMGGPRGFFGVGELYTGGTKSDALCTAVPTDQIAGGTWRITYSPIASFKKIETFVGLT